jgi:hypothetical protein
MKPRTGAAVRTPENQTDNSEMQNPTPANERAFRAARDFLSRFMDAETDTVHSSRRSGPAERETVYGALLLLMAGDADESARAKRMLLQLGPPEGHFSICAMLLAAQKLGDLLDDDLRAMLKESLRGRLDEKAEDIIAGRNINLPLQTWCVRLAAGLAFDREDLVAGAAAALGRLAETVRAHGSLPEFNSPVYQPITLQALHVIAGLGDPRCAALAEPLRLHLWEEMAWRFHPRLRVLCGPWGRTYQDGLAGAGSNAESLMDQAWGAFHDDQLPYEYDHGCDILYGPLLGLFAGDAPESAREIATDKAFPLTVVSRAEQVDYQLGDVWVPGGVAKLTTWMDEHRAIGSASRPHVHGMQSAAYLAHWTRTGEPVERIDDLGIAYTHFVQNGRRPGEAHRYRNHHHGQVVDAGPALWADDGRPAVLQSGPTALIVYVPKGQERQWVRTLELFMAVPRLDTVDAVLVDGQAMEEDLYEGDPGASVVVRSGKAALGLRFAACDPSLSSPRLRIERSRNHLFVGLRLVDFDEERELPEKLYRRYGASIGAELRWAPTDDDMTRLVDDMRDAVLTDDWWMGGAPNDLGGPRRVRFTVADKTLRGRHAPVAETWLGREVPPAEGNIVEVRCERSRG